MFADLRALRAARLDQLRRMPSRVRPLSRRRRSSSSAWASSSPARPESAQLPLHTWLPDAMEGPTPSLRAHPRGDDGHRRRLPRRALLGALERLRPRRASSSASSAGSPALSGAILGVVQWDIKRVLAYSTMSQIGYVIMGVGADGRGRRLGVLHFFTHAFFKALLFLASGLIIFTTSRASRTSGRWVGCAVGCRWRSGRSPSACWRISRRPALLGISFSKDAIVYGMLTTGHPWLFA